MAKQKKVKKKKVLKVKKVVKKPKKVLVRKSKPKTKNQKPKPQTKKKKTVKVTKRKVGRKPQPRKIKKVPAQDSSFVAESFFKAKIKVIGIGGGGGSIVSEIGRSLNKATFVVADTDMRAFKKRPGIKNFLFGQSLTHGLGTGVNPELGRQAAESEKEKIAEFFTDQDIVIFIASLGGGLGSGATRVFAEAAKDFNGITLGIFTLPFKFEGKNKYKIALKALRELRNSLNVSITIPNEKIFKIIDANTAITDAFSTVNKSLIESLESLIDLIYSPGIINIDFADLRVILKGKGNLAFLNTAQAQGKDRVEVIVRDILHNPLYQSNNFTADKILFNVAGGDTLSMFEVDKISRAIGTLNPKAKIIFGISKNAKYKNKIKTTLLMTGPGLVKQEAPKVIEKTVIVAKKSIVKRVKKVIKKPSLPKEKPSRIPGKQTLPAIDTLMPAFNKTFLENQPVLAVAKRVSIMEASEKPKKAIRRSALEIKKAQEVQDNKQTLQEKEWEIPAFLRLKK